MNNNFNIGGDFYIDEKNYIHSRSEYFVQKMNRIEKISH